MYPLRAPHSQYGLTFDWELIGDVARRSGIGMMLSIKAD
jgi:hypothetical protein